MQFQHSFALSFNGANIKIQINIVLQIEFLKKIFTKKAASDPFSNVTPLLIYIKLSNFFSLLFSLFS